MIKRVAIIAGGGPAGLTAALELLDKTDVVPIVYEADSMVGGLAKTVNYKGNRIDIGGHRDLVHSVVAGPVQPLSGSQAVVRKPYC